MPTLARKGLPEVWPSSLSSILAGDQSCLLKSWLPAHFRLDKMPGTFDFANWKIEHTALLNVTVKRLEKDGWKCSIEDQNRFRVTGTTCILVGKPDIVARKGTKIRAVDCKTGEPKDAHGVQVGIYMIALPLGWERPTLYVEGEVAYKGHQVYVEPEEVQGLKPRLFALLRQMGASERPSATPSEKGCLYCEIQAVDCPDRYNEAATPAVTTDLF